MGEFINITLESLRNIHARKKKSIKATLKTKQENNLEIYVEEKIPRKHFSFSPSDFSGEEWGGK
jgi:hypothetical protein